MADGTAVGGAASGVVGPFAMRVKHTRMEEHTFYAMIGEVLVSSLHKNPVNMCVEVARRHAPSRVRPSFDEIEQRLKELKQAA